MQWHKEVKILYFLIAIGIWIYILYSIKKDKREHEKVSRNTQQWFDSSKENFDNFIERYIAPDSMIDYAEHAVYSDSEIAKNIKERIKTEIGLRATDDMAIRAILAQYGKIVKKTAYGGIRTSIYGRERMGFERKFMIWYDKELQAHGFDFPLLFVTWNNKLRLKSGDDTVAVPVNQCEEIVSGIYFWEPIKAFASGLDNVVV